MQWETLAPPANGNTTTVAAWADSVDAWRTAERQRLGLPSIVPARASSQDSPAPGTHHSAVPNASANGTTLPYDDPALAWVRGNFVSPQVRVVLPWRVLRVPHWVTRPCGVRTCR